MDDHSAASGEGAGVPPPPPGAPDQALSPWLAIWLRPRAAMRRILDTDPRRGVMALVVVAALVGATGVAAEPRIALLLRVPSSFILTVAYVALPICSIVGLYLFGFLIALTGRWLEGQGDAAAVRAALAWSRVPLIWGGLLVIPRLILASAPGADAGDLTQNPGAAILQGVLGMLQLILGVWAVVVMLKCLGEAHRFSAWRALGAFILSWLLFTLCMLTPAVVAFLVLRGIS